VKKLLWLSLLAGTMAHAEINKSDVVEGYIDLTYTNDSDELHTAEHLQHAVNILVKSASPEALAAAKETWLAARPSYQQSEVFRFGNSVVGDWEGELNA
jgi:putative iron-regulated protein